MHYRKPSLLKIILYITFISTVITCTVTARGVVVPLYGFRGAKGFFIMVAGTFSSAPLPWSYLEVSVHWMAG
jgi:hypothetical protein